MKGVGYNTNQSEIAIGQGAGLGKVFFEGHKPKEGLFRSNIPITFLPRLVKSGDLQDQ